MRVQVADFGRLLLLALAANGVAQTRTSSEEPITREKLVEVAKIFFRDVSEFPMRLDTSLVAVKSSGKVVRSKQGTADIMFRGGWKRPYGEGTVRPPENFLAALRSGRGIMPLARAMGNTSLWAAAPVELLMGVSPDSTLQIGVDNAPLMVEMVPNHECPALTMVSQPKAYVPDKICGTSRWQLDQDFSFQHYEFDAAGLPAPADVEPFGKCTLQSYHVETEFHKVMLAEDETPFLVPRSVIVTLETDKGKLEFTSTFEPQSPEIH